MRPIVRTVLAFAAAALTGFVAGSVLHTQFVLARLSAVGAEIPFSDRLRMTLGDIVGLVASYGAIVALALAAGFVVAWIARRFLRPLAPVAYPLAGGAAVATALWLMHLQFEMTPLAGARGTLGFLAQCAAGVLAGLVFARMRPRLGDRTP